MHLLHNAEILCFTFEITNSGQSPARETQVIITAYPKDRQTRLKALPSSINPLGDVGFGGTVPLYLSVEVAHDLPQALEGKKVVFDVDAVVSYRTVFSKQVETETIRYFGILYKGDAMISPPVRPDTEIPAFRTGRGFNARKPKGK